MSVDQVSMLGVCTSDLLGVCASVLFGVCSSVLLHVGVCTSGVCTSVLLGVCTSGVCASVLLGVYIRVAWCVYISVE